MIDEEELRKEIHEKIKDLPLSEEQKANLSKMLLGVRMIANGSYLYRQLPKNEPERQTCDRPRHTKDA